MNKIFYWQCLEKPQATAVMNKLTGASIPWGNHEAEIFIIAILGENCHFREKLPF